MGVLADCPELFTTAGPGLFLYQQADPGPVQADEQVYDLAAQAMEPDGVALLIPESALASDDLRAHLQTLVAADGRLVVVPFRPGTSGLLDLDSSVRAQDRLGVVIGVPASAVEGTGPTDLAARLVPVESTAEPGTTVRPPVAYRLLPETLVANRRRLAELATTDAPPSVTRLVEHSATGAAVTAGGDGSVSGDLSPLAGVYYAVFGDLPHQPLVELLTATSPLSRPALNDALGLDSTPMPPANVLRELDSGRAAAVLVHASATSLTPGSFWLVKDDAGQLRWATGDQPVASVVLDGAVDRRTAVLEDPYSEFVVVAPDGTPYRPQLPAEPTWTPRMSANARRSGDTILLGPDGPSAATERIMADLDHLGGQNVLVNVRRGGHSRHGTTLDPLTAESVHRLLTNNPGITRVVATAGNDQLSFIAAEQHRRSVVQPAMVGFDEYWEVQGARSPYRERYRALSDGALARAEALADPPKTALSESVAGLITQPTWVAAEAYLKRFFAELIKPEVALELTRLVAATVANGKQIYRYGSEPIENHPFYRRDRTLPAFQVLVEQELRAQEDHNPDGGRPLEPQHASLTDPVDPYTRTVGSALSLGYLTTRRLDAARLGQEAGGYMMNLLWLREVVRAAYDRPATKFSLTDARAVVGAKGELEEERAARRPGQPEIDRAHAAVVDALADLEGDGGAASWRKHLTAADCLTGTDRVLWHFVFRHVITPQSEPHRAEIKGMQNFLYTCNSKARV